LMAACSSSIRFFAPHFGQVMMVVVMVGYLTDPLSIVEFAGGKGQISTFVEVRWCSMSS
jgi:hypothetical protein